jgi:hypothetical protein
VKWRESTVKPSRNVTRRTKYNTAAPEERSTEPHTGAGEHTELSLLARSELRERIWMTEQACSMTSMVAWSCCGSGLPPGQPCMAAATPDRAWRVVGSLRSPRVRPSASGSPAGRGGWFRYGLLA